MSILIAFADETPGPGRSATSLVKCLSHYQVKLFVAKLAYAIHDYHRQLGCPFARYFILLSSKTVNNSLAGAVLRDQMRTSDYLRSRNLKVLRQWERPYRV
ncbi:MAG: hypothetical protein QNJ78_11210 [Gammaproteobacteria bacterium]|nr:hypothetical protein [Gammaproteobacteria bacterium]